MCVCVPGVINRVCMISTVCEKESACLGRSGEPSEKELFRKRDLHKIQLLVHALHGSILQQTTVTKVLLDNDVYRR